MIKQCQWCNQPMEIIDCYYHLMFWCDSIDCGHKLERQFSTREDALSFIEVNCAPDKQYGCVKYTRSDRVQAILNALEFYANSANYHNEESPFTWVMDAPVLDRGSKAREAIELFMGEV